MIKKLAAVTAALTIAICSFTSCSKNNDSSSTVSSTVDSSVSAVDSTTEKQTPEPSLTIDGKTIDTKDFIVCTIDGKDIDFDTLVPRVLFGLCPYYRHKSGLVDE